MNKIKHFINFGIFGEQEYYYYPDDIYDGIIFNGNIIANSPNGIASFLLKKSSQFSYIIDPMTHAFQHSIKAISKKNNIKESIVKQIGYLGDPFTIIKNENRVLTPSDINDFEALIKNTISFSK